MIERHSCNSSDCKSCLYPKNSNLKGLPVAELEKLDNARTSTEYKKGQLIYRGGTYPSGIFCLNQGYVMKTLTGHGDKETIVNIYGPGAFLGLSDYFTNSTYRYNCVALTDASICMIRKEEIDQLFTSNHHFLKKVLGHISAQYNEYVHRSIAMQSKTMIQRLAAAIVFVLNKVGVDQKTNELKAYLKRKEWALLAHMNTSNVIRSFGALQTDGIVATDNKKLVIIDKKQLLALAE